MNEVKLFTVLNRIADALEAIAATTPTATPATDQAPNYTQSIADYPDFNWSSIGAKVALSDKSGAIVVHWHKQEYKRRSHETYGKDFWFSRYIGTENGKRIYTRLITFKDEETNAKALPSSITDTIPTSPTSPTSPTIATTTSHAQRINAAAEALFPSAPPPAPARPAASARAILDAAFPR